MQLTIDLTGKASLAYRGFPYRIHRARGRITLGGNEVRIRSVSGSAGPMQCVLDGWVRGSKAGTSAELTLDVTAMPLDEALARALPQPYRDAYLACGLSGRVDIARAVVRRRPGRPMELDIPAALTDASLCYRGVPYRLTGVSGTLRITREGVRLEHLVGRHGRAKVAIGGHVGPRPGGPEVDLAIEASGLPLDAELRQALPAEVRRWWDLFDPAGLADLTLRLHRRPTPSAGAAARQAGVGTSPASRPASGGWDYHLLLRPRDVRVRYRHFPYLLRGLAGTVEVVPGRMRLEGITARARGAKVSLAGQVMLSGAGQQADLRLSTGAVTIDKQLLSALPAGLVSALRLRPGGTAAVDFKHLRLRHPGVGPGPTTARTRPSGPTTSPAPTLTWAWSGTVRVADAVLDLGTGPKRITGALSGRMACAGDARGLEVDAGLMLESVLIGPRRVRRLSAELSKRPRSSVLKVDRLVGRTFGGRLDGFARIRLSDPPEYGLNISVEDMDLNAFLNAGRLDPKSRFDIKGRLTGILKMTGVRGRPETRRADGRFRITQGKLCKLPVLLGFLHLIYLTLPSDAAFHTAEVAYTIRGHRLVFHEISLRGSALSMVGAGSLDLRREKLKLTFLAGPPHKLPRLAGLSDVIEGLGSVLQTWRVTGTVTHPVVKLVPLASPAKTLEELYNP